MRVTSCSPEGAIQHIDLTQLPIWRLELATVGKSRLAVGFRYVASGTTAFAALAALDCIAEDGAVASIARVGFPRPTHASNIERLQEAMKLLYNTDVKPQQVDELIAKSTGLVDIYHDVIRALQHEGEAQGRYEGYRWAIHKGTALVIPSVEEK